MAVYLGKDKIAGISTSKDVEGSNIYVHYLDLNLETEEPGEYSSHQRCSAIIVNRSEQPFTNTLFKEYCLQNDISSMTKGITLIGKRIITDVNDSFFQEENYNRVWYNQDDDKIYALVSMGIFSDTSFNGDKTNWYVRYDGYGGMREVPITFNIDFDTIIKI